jgi:3D (Asp-Asp-Asp) domain-containing protein
MKQILTNPEIFYEEKPPSIWWELAVFIILALILGGGIYLLSLKPRDSKRIPSFSNVLASEDSKRFNPVVDCKNDGEGFICGTHVYRNVKWHYNQKTIIATVTAYDAQSFPGLTASGHVGHIGSSVACPRSIRIGSHIQLGSIGRFVCDDRTALRFDGRFDLFLGTRKEALAFGKKTLEVTIYYSSSTKI